MLEPFFGNCCHLYEYTQVILKYSLLATVGNGDGNDLKLLYITPEKLSKSEKMKNELRRLYRRGYCHENDCCVNLLNNNNKNNNISVKLF